MGSFSVVQIQLSLILSSEGLIICMVEMKRELSEKINLVMPPSLRFVSGQDLDGMRMVMVAFPVQKPIMNVIMVSWN